MDFDIKRGGEPPKPVRVHTAAKYGPIAEAAIDAAGEWIHVDDVPSSLGVGIRKGEAKGFEPRADGTFEALTRNVDKTTKRCTLWVRFVPKEDDA